MSKATILVNLQRCTGCWTCALACKVANDLPDDEYREVVRTEGSGEGIDRPAGTWPDLHMSWIPIWKKSCTKCPERIGEGEEPFCVYACPNGALSVGDAARAAEEKLRADDFRIFELPAWEDSREDVVYASK